MAKDKDKPTPETTEAGAEQASRPIAKFSGSGGINAAVWKHKSDSGPDHYSVRLDRTFRHDGGDYDSTPYLREGDLLRAQKLLGQADDWIEQDKAKNRSRSGGEASAGRV
jgi:hypothetical protein